MIDTCAHLINLRQSLGSGCAVGVLSVLQSRSFFNGQAYPVKGGWMWNKYLIMFLILVFFRWVTMGKAPNKELWLDLVNLQCFLRHYFHHHHHHHCHHLRPRCNLVHQAEEDWVTKFFCICVAILILYLGAHNASSVWVAIDTVFGTSPCKWHTDNIRSRCISGRFEDSHCEFKHKPFYHFHQYHPHGLCHYMMVSLWSPSSSSFTASFISFSHACHCSRIPDPSFGIPHFHLLYL